MTNFSIDLANQPPPSDLWNHRWGRRQGKLFKLVDVLPKPGMIYEKIRDGNGKILPLVLSERRRIDEEVTWALWDNTPDITETRSGPKKRAYKIYAKAMILPIFGRATELIKVGQIPSVREGHVDMADAPQAWCHFLVHPK